VDRAVDRVVDLVVDRVVVVVEVAMMKMAMDRLTMMMMIPP
jgi:hypothetical protein